MRLHADDDGPERSLDPVKRPWLDCYVVRRTTLYPTVPNRGPSKFHAPITGKNRPKLLRVRFVK